MTAPDASRWAKVQELFGSALEVPHAERRAFVTSHCGADADLALEVLSLLAADAEDPGYLDGMAAGLGGLVREPDIEKVDASDRPPTRSLHHRARAGLRGHGRGLSGPPQRRHL